MGLLLVRRDLDAGALRPYIPGGTPARLPLSQSLRADQVSVPFIELETAITSCSVVCN